MKAFTNVTVTKPQFMKEIRKHQKADAFVRGTYERMEDNDVQFKGCAVGCSLHSVARIKGIQVKFGDHGAYEKHLGIPEWLARVEDTIFEGVSAERAQKWPVEFANAINVGANLDKAKAPFMIFLMEQNLKSMKAAKYDKEKFPQVAATIVKSEDAVKQVIAFWKKYPKGPGSSEAARSAADSARSAAYSARSAARSAAYSAAYERAADALIKILKKTK